MIQVIGFDADDTLWENEIHYLRAKDEFKQMLSGYQNPDVISQRLDEIEVGNIEGYGYGYGIKGFTLSMIETAMDVSRGKVTISEISRLLEIAKEMLTAEVELVDHVEDTLGRLADEHDLMLITKGDRFEQERKIDRSGLAGYFRYIEVVGEKSKAVYQALFEKYQIDPERFLMVGNSLRSDIVPVAELGGKAIYIPNDRTWFHEMVPSEDLEKIQYVELEHMGQVTEYIESLSLT
jgi:putative hydrolase of the HAD superfamily